jgi:hypothetical protein
MSKKNNLEKNMSIQLNELRFVHQTVLTTTRYISTLAQRRAIINEELHSIDQLARLNKNLLDEQLKKITEIKSNVILNISLLLIYSFEIVVNFLDNTQYQRTEGARQTDKRRRSIYFYIRRSTRDHHC